MSIDTKTLGASLAALAALTLAGCSSGAEEGADTSPERETSARRCGGRALRPDPFASTYTPV